MNIPQKSASFLGAQVTAANDLGNRCSVLLSYRGKGDFPRVSATCGQCRTRERREGHRFVSSHKASHSVHDSVSPSRRCSSASVADRMNSDLLPFPATASTRRNSASLKRTGVCLVGLSLSSGERPIRGGVADTTLESRVIFIPISLLTLCDIGFSKAISECKAQLTYCYGGKRNG